MKSVLCILTTIGILVGAAALFVWSGSYSVSATVPHWDSTHRIIETVLDRSIENHSRGISVPSLKDPKYMELGFHHYHPMCRRCHGAPGVVRDEFAQGLYPGPPDLAKKKLQEEWSDAEVYWIIKNGIKMTGMPAFGINHDEDELWGMVAFFRRLPNMKPGEYKEMANAIEHRTGPEEADHHNGHEHP